MYLGNRARDVPEALPTRLGANVQGDFAQKVIWGGAANKHACECQ